MSALMLWRGSLGEFAAASSSPRVTKSRTPALQRHLPAYHTSVERPRQSPLCCCLPASSDDSSVQRPQTQSPAASSPQPSSQQRNWAKRQRFLNREPGDVDDVVEINCGGEVMLTLRSTLTQVPGSRLKEMFSLRGAGDTVLKKDLKGQVFLDYDPYCFGQVLRLLRSLKMNGGSWKGLSMPVVRSSEEKHFRHLLNYLLSPQVKEVPGATFPVNALSKERKQILGQEEEEEEEDAKRQGQRHLQKQEHSLAANSDQEQVANSQVSLGAATEAGPAMGRALFPTREPRGSSRGEASHSSAVNELSIPDSETSQPDAKLASSSNHYQTPPQHPYQQRRGSGHTNSKAVGNSSSLSSNYPTSGTPSSQQPSSRASMVFSQMYYIHVQSDARRGTKISVSTEADLAARSPSNTEPFDVFGNTTYTGTQMSFSFVCRRDFDDIFIGLTSRSQLDRKGASIPSMGWRGSSGTRLYSARPAGRPESMDDESEEANAGPRKLWGKGDCVELIVTMTPPSNNTSSSSSSSSSQSSSSWLASRMVLKVNGREVDSIEQLPPLRSWCWYLALHTGGDVSCVSFLRDSYSVFWGDYQVKRFI